MVRGTHPTLARALPVTFDAERRGRHSQTEFGNEETMNGIWERGI